MDTTNLRAVLAQWATGVVVVTTRRDDGGRHGMTASSFTSVALDPPLVSICLTTASTTCRLIRRSGVFAINVLGHGHRDIGHRFASATPDVTERFAVGEWETAASGVAVLSDAVAWLDCEVVACHPAGDHTIVLGRVRDTATPRPAPPLIYHDRTYHEGIVR